MLLQILVTYSFYSEHPTPLRREKTFDLGPNTNLKDVKVRK